MRPSTKHQALSTILLPFAWLYAAVLAVRNWLYDHGWKASAPGWVPLVGVGNLRVGGTGKTPHVIWVVEELLRQGQRPAILSRGYGRQTQGPRLATLTDSAATVGDEPWQYFEQFSTLGVPVAVAENRQLGLDLLRQHHPELTTVVLDDAYQHRRVRPTLNILLTELARPFYHDYVLPAGRLRETRAGAARADVVIITKCPPDIMAEAQAEATAQVRRYARPGAPVLFSAYAYTAPQPLTAAARALGAPRAGQSALLLTGIAQPGPLREHLLAAGFQLAEEFIFPDHHAFAPADLGAVRARWRAGQPIFTTEKDATRLLAPALDEALAGLPVYTIPVRVALLGTGAARLRALLPGASPSSPVLL
ncbi:tetraacyldisaccharide 4'-kinase [Hymenobacter sp. BT559]|uniref:tetraacyldisaccharide 4'-kinase n=1 Tax=Hymenobacter sp. BT559 TaxID=2795729 RepID=UPI0018EBB7FA|nr:tetraacyldisaccharide 4'-kinase [Hymenobacter sp. BT559]MBJ6146009.1 tetraacyldisaccharide 4'-kinase [Hymenobacter sp. BT559]